MIRDFLEVLASLQEDYVRLLQNPDLHEFWAAIRPTLKKVSTYPPCKRTKDILALSIQNISSFCHLFAKEYSK
jgi:hypothetical protein